MKFYRGDGGFVKKVRFTQNGKPINLVTAFPGNVTIRWWFKRSDGTKREIDWDQQQGQYEGDDNEIALFGVPEAFFNEVIDYDSQFEIFNDEILVLHSKIKFTVSVEEPAGLHTDEVEP